MLFREAGQPYFKRLAVPRRYRWLGAWRTLSTYAAEQQLLPVGGRDLHHRIQQFFATHTRLRIEFQLGGMPSTAIRVLRQHSSPSAAALARIHCLECTAQTQDTYQVILVGGPEPPPNTIPTPAIQPQ
ncbi:MAG: hypothetical protein FJZ47_18860 [Candidatus Tectomicrobia bacterium]|uniref:Uncharacterized protein n=1 Tax=Tectimicrobiota bacterium TaxID=2528274 RepID=A0A938B487_UNCTE|nr:hypothetical protein [Candidatus Tectomicrobia bacterium]